MWFDTWSDVQRILLVGASVYVLLVVLLRVSGKRTLSKLNAFDFVVTIALGSTLATVLLDSKTSLLDGFVALALLTSLQLLTAAATTRLHQAVRATGNGDLAGVAAVVLETDGSMSVISTSTAGDLSALPHH